MIHTLHTMNVREYGQVDQTNDISLLKKWFNPFPVKWFDTDSFFISYREMMSNDITGNIVNDKYRILAYNKIIILDQMLKTMSVLMRNQNDRSMFRLLFKYEPKEYTGNYSYYVEKVKQITGIEIKDGDDLVKLQNEIQRLLDKFHERFKEKEIPDTKVEFIDIVLGVFSIMEMAYVSEMKLSEFGRLKLLADKRIKAIEKSNGKH